jgi:parallel beta-helix repeat protein
VRRISPVVAVALAAFALPAVAGAKTFHVKSGDSIQAAVGRADPGDTVEVAPGTYTERSRPCPYRRVQDCAVAITDDRIELVAKSARKPVVLKAKGEQDDGIGVGEAVKPTCLNKSSQRLHGSLIAGFDVRGFKNNGVFLGCVEDWRITRVRATGNDEYGIFPSHAVDGRLDHSFASGANDTGLYIGQSRDARMDHNTAIDNVSGFEIENSSGVRADHNLAKGNSGGILSFALPGLDVKSNEDNRIDHNRVVSNNRRNTCSDQEETVCRVPPGSGILVLSADRNLVQDNRVTGNDTFGIGVANYCIVLEVSPEQCERLDIDPDPDGNRITANTVTGNAKDPDPSTPSVFAVDLAWDTTGDGNCWSDNRFDTSFPDPLPVCG